MSKSYSSKIFKSVLVFTAIFIFANLAINASTSGVDKRVSSLLIKAMKARDAGQLEEAELYWQQAKMFKANLKRPAWLDKKLEQPEPIFTRQEYLNRLDAISYEKAKELINSRLENAPADYELRRKLAQLAEKAGDKKEAETQKLILGEKENNSHVNVVKFVIALIIFALLVWQIVMFWQDSHTGRK